MLLVTGGYDTNVHYLDSTELLLPGSGSWSLATGLLPRPMAYMRVATVANTLYLTGRIVIILLVMMGRVLMLYPGGYNSPNPHYYDEILEFRPDTEDWSLAGRMLEARGWHAVSTINFEDVEDFCMV